MYSVHTVACMSLPTNMMTKLTTIADPLLIDRILPKHIPLIIKDLTKFRLNRHCKDTITIKDNRPARSFLNLQFDNKGIEMINLPQILNNKSVIDAIPSFLTHKQPPIVSYSYTQTMGPKILNYKQCIKNLDFDVGTNHMSCKCNNSTYIDTNIGHMLTGNLNIIRDRKLRNVYRKDLLTENKRILTGIQI